MLRVVPVLLGVVVMLQISQANSELKVKEESQKLMLILLDGFRWDYVEKYNLPNFKRLQSIGVRAESLENVFPTLSFPNYYSIVTGLYVESHQMVGNQIYDREKEETFYMNYDMESFLKPHWWEHAWPIWVSMEKQGKSAHMYYWLGTEVLIHDTRPTFFVPYTGKPTPQDFRTAFKNGLAALTNGSADFVGIYNQEPDDAGHLYGPNSADVEGILDGIDGIIGNLLDELEDLPSNETVNLMIVSDHGMATIDRSRLINLTSILTPDLYTTITEDSTMCNIFLSDPSLEDKVYNLLADFHPHMTVYRLEDIPDRFHYKHGIHVPRITCIADKGWVIVHPLKTYFYTNKKTGEDWKGIHGYDNNLMDMRGIFYGMGPYFQAGSSVKSLRVVDLYNVMCGILGITPKPNNGTFQQMSQLLASGAQSQMISCQIVAVVSTIMLLIL